MGDKNNEKIIEELTNEELEGVTGGAIGNAAYIGREPTTPRSYRASKPIPQNGLHIDDEDRETTGTRNVR